MSGNTSLSLARESVVDVERLRQEVARLRLLAEATNAITSRHLDLPAILDTVATRVAHAVGDSCVIRLVSADGLMLEPVAVHHRHPDADLTLRAVVDTHPYRTDDGLQGQVYRTGQPAFLERAWLDALPDAERERYLHWFATREAESLLIVPLALSGQVFGTLALLRDAGGDPYRAEDRELACALADRAAIAVHDARTHAEALRLGAYARALLDGAADAILVSDEQGRYIDANRAAEDLYGYAREELLAMSVGDLVVDDREAYRQLLTGQSADASPLEWRDERTIRRKDGTLIPVEGRVSSVRLPEGGVVYVGSTRDISERQRLNQLQRDVIRMVSHDLRTPLTVMRGLAQLMLRRNRPDPEKLGQIIEQTDRMQRMLADLLDVERAEAGAFHLTTEPVELIALAREVVGRVALLGERAFRLDPPERLVVGQWDRGRLEQVLENLLSNAVKYTPDDGEIVVRVRPDGDVARLEVADRGVGIPPEALPHLFERFYRVEGDGHGATEGVGLGLYITKSLVEAMGGRIEVASQVGIGSTFTVRLPLVGAAAEAVSSAQP